MIKEERLTVGETRCGRYGLGGSYDMADGLGVCYSCKSLQPGEGSGYEVRLGGDAAAPNSAREKVTSFSSRSITKKGSSPNANIECMHAKSQQE